MKKLYTLLFMLLIGFSLEAQEIVSSGGKTQATAGYELSWTVGEAVTTTVSDGTNTLTQGFHQSKLTVTAIPEVSDTGIELRVFPNPTQEYITIQFQELVKNSVYYLFDMSGKILSHQSIETTKTKLNMKSYPSGTYLLQLTVDGQKSFRNYKIMKD